MRISAATRLGVVLGDPVDHSISPQLHNAAFAALAVDAVFVAVRVGRAELAGAVSMLRATGAVGASVTIPHKTAVIDCCDRLAKSAEDVGAVNCIAFEGTEIVGHNTDAPGFVASLAARFEAPEGGWKPLVLGGGGAARAVSVGLGGARVVVRDPSKVSWTDAEPWTEDSLAALLPNCNLVIDCTPVGLSAESEARIPAPIDLGLCPDRTVVSSLVYHRETDLVAGARQRGLETLDGRGMLIHQALGALEIWLGRAPVADVLWNAWPDKTA